MLSMFNNIKTPYVRQLIVITCNSECQRTFCCRSENYN